jgi:hypothetical protein
MNLFQVNLEMFESIVPGGVRKVAWFIRSGDDWTRVSEHTDAHVEKCDVGPGTVWLWRVALSLPLGARLMRVESIPRRAPARDPLAYIVKPNGARDRDTRRSYFAVGARGKLERLAEPPRSM